MTALCHAPGARPAFRRPWEDGARAYHEADSLDAILPGIKRLRNPLTVLIHHEKHALDGVKCDSCGCDLAGPYELRSGGADLYAMVDVDPRSKTYIVRHYYCAWMGVMTEVMRLRHKLG